MQSCLIDCLHGFLCVASREESDHNEISKPTSVTKRIALFNFIDHRRPHRINMFGKFLDRLCGAPNLGKEGENKSRAFGFGSSPPKISVYEEALTMLNGALTIYLVADLRALARAGKATVELKDLEAPIGTDKVLSIIKDNVDNLISSEELKEDLEGRLHALEALNQRTTGLFGKGQGSTVLVEFVDTNAETELVHAITVNETKKRITVLFRGSVTKTDFITDAKVAQTKLENPVKRLNEDCTDTINIHSGFHEYLFKKNCPNTGKPRYESILDSVHKLLEEHPGFDLYCTGHSLGAALCTYFGFHAAANDKTAALCKKPVRVISVASPYVGNVKFMVAFQALERLGRLQHLRIANAEDVVTLMPVLAPKPGMISPIFALFDGMANLYKHCGMKLLLKGTVKNEGDPIHTISYALDQSKDEAYAKEITSMFEDTKNLFSGIKLVFKNEAEKVVGYHGCGEYERRLMKCQDNLCNKTLDDLYKDKSIVGDILDEGYKPQVMTSAKERIARIGASETIKQSIFGKSETANAEEK